MEIKFIMPDSLKSTLSETEVKGIEIIGNQLAEQLNKGLSVDGITSVVTKALEDQGFKKEAIDEINKALTEQGAILTGLKESPGKTERQTMKQQLKDFMSADSFKQAIKERKETSIEIKAAPATITASNFTGAQPWILTHEVLPGIGAEAKEPNIIFQMLNSGTTNSRDIYWVNRAPINGEAEFIGESELKPLVDWTYTKESSNAKKVADATKVSTEMLDDFDYMESEIRDVLRTLVEDKTDEQILNGDGTGDNLTGILTNASAYVGTNLDGKIAGANVIDAIRAIVLQMRLLHQRPNAVLMNPVDKAAIDLLKNSTHNYISAEAKAVINDLRIIETTAITPGKIVVLDTSKFKVRVYKGLTINFGWENDDFRRNLVTVICEMRLHSYHSEIDNAAIVYDDIATIMAALKTV